MTMLILCKFVRNDNPQSTNTIVTKTLGKFGVPDREALAKMDRKPAHNEWWYCEIVRETKPGTEKGVWVLKPIRFVEPIERDGYRLNNITHLVPGLFDIKRKDNVLLIYPKHKGPNWICPNPMRRHLMLKNRKDGCYGVNTIMVVHDDSEVW